MVRHIDDLVAEDIPSMSTKELWIVRDMLKEITFVERYSRCAKESRFVFLMYKIEEELRERKERGEKIR